MVPHFTTIKLEAWALKQALTYLKNSVAKWTWQPDIAYRQDGRFRIKNSCKFVACRIFCF